MNFVTRRKERTKTTTTQLKEQRKKMSAAAAVLCFCKKFSLRTSKLKFHSLYRVERSFDDVP